MGYNPFDFLGTDKKERIGKDSISLAQGVVENKLRETIRGLIQNRLTEGKYVYAIVDKFDVRKQDYDQVYFKDSDLKKVQRKAKSLNPKLWDKYGMTIIKVDTKGKISDLEEGGKGSGRKAKPGGAKDIENKAMSAADAANAKMDAAEKAMKKKKKKKNEGKLTEGWKPIAKKNVKYKDKTGTYNWEIESGIDTDSHVGKNLEKGVVPKIILHYQHEDETGYPSSGGNTFWLKHKNDTPFTPQEAKSLVNKISNKKIGEFHRKSRFPNGSGQNIFYQDGKFIREGKLTEDIGTDTYLGGIAQALKKAGVRYKKATVMKKGFMNRKSDVGFFITIDDDIVLPLEVRKDGDLYYEIEKSIKLGKWADTNKIAQAFKKLSKIDGWGQSKLVKKEGNITEDYSNSEWEVYVADEKGKEKIVKVAKSKRAGVILYNKLIKSDKYHEVGMRVIKEGKLNENKLKSDFPGFSSKEYKVIQNWIDMGSHSQTVAMYKKNKKSFSQFVKDAAKDGMFESKLSESTIRLSTHRDAAFHGNIMQLIGKKHKMGMDKKSVKALFKAIRQYMKMTFEQVKLTEGKTLRLPNGIKVKIGMDGLELTDAGGRIKLDRRELEILGNAARKQMGVRESLTGAFKSVWQDVNQGLASQAGDHEDDEDEDNDDKKVLKGMKEGMDKRKAATILKQIGGNRFIAMTGAKDFAFSNKYMSFKIGRNSKGINFVRIGHNAKDLYDMEFGFVSVKGIKVKKKADDVYADMLGQIFKKYTGMNVRL